MALEVVERSDESMRFVSEKSLMFLGLKENEFTNDRGQNISYNKITFCDMDSGDICQFNDMTKSKCLELKPRDNIDLIIDVGSNLKARVFDYIVSNEQ